MNQKRRNENNEMWSEMNIAAELNTALTFSVPRYAINSRFSLHAFSDASQRAYGAVVYAVDGNRSWLLMSKAKVAPIRTLTIPQLELTAFLLAARLLCFVSKAYKHIDIISKHIWCDSQIVLHWLVSKRTLKPFIQNRVDEINKILPKFNKHFVPSAENPGDLVSRGSTSKIFLKFNSMEKWSTLVDRGK